MGKKSNQKRIPTPELMSFQESTYFPSMKEPISYAGASLKVVTRYRKDVKQATEKSIASGSSNINNTAGIILNKQIQLVTAIQDPRNGGFLSRLESVVRRNWAVRSALSVRENFMFGYGSEIIIELSEAEKVGKSEEEIAKEVESLTLENIEIIKEAYNRDEDTGLVKNMRTFMWQAWCYARGCTVMMFESPESPKVTRLQTVNTRRLGMPILNIDQNMEFEGCVVDGQGLAKESMIYGAYQDVQISPHTEWYGYTPMETILHIAEALNIGIEEDFKEILKSAWLASILFRFNTAGLTAPQAKKRMESLIGSIKAGKYIGINDDIKDAEQLNLNPDYTGLIAMTDNLETKIYKALDVPQFLVQSESIANRATALQSATLFINGVVTADQTWLSDLLTEQWYDPFLRQKLTGKENLGVREVQNAPKDSIFNRFEAESQQDTFAPNIAEPAPPPLKFHLRRVFNQAKVADFLDLAQSITQLVGAGIWDTQQANEELGTEDVTNRIALDEDSIIKNEQFKSMFNLTGDKFNETSMSDKEKIIKTAGLTAERKIRINKNKEFREAKLLLLKELTEKIASENEKAGVASGKGKKHRSRKS